MTTRSPKPPWLKTSPGGGERFAAVRSALRAGRSHTVCEEARCPNRGECWSAGTATFLLLGDVCTRGCAFCSVARGDPKGVVDPEEPARTAAVAAELGLDYVVLTSVTRDDLEDGGAAHLSAAILAIRTLDRRPLVEALVPDFGPEPLKLLLDAEPSVLAHNIEVVERLTPAMRHARFSYRGSLEVLASMRGLGFTGPIKSSILLGLGETERELEAAIRDLRTAGCDLLVLGQYLQPTSRHPAPVRYVPPDEFDAWRRFSEGLGFAFTASSPLARTSYRAVEAFAASLLQPQGTEPWKRNATT